MRLFGRTRCGTCSPWLPHVALGLAAVSAGVVVGVAGARLERQRGELTALRQQLGEQHALIETFKQRVASVRSEIVAWSAVHGRMSEAFGPDTGKKRAGTGVGGGTPVVEPVASVVARHPQDELDLLAASVAEEGPRLRELERVVERTGKMMNALPLRWPVRGPVNSEFGRRSSPWGGETEQHDGMDIGSPAGTPVKAPSAATVATTANSPTYGKYITLNHGNGVRSIYGHLQRISVKPGQRVAKGDVIGLVGSTGRSTGPHLHYEIRVDGERVNPRGFLFAAATSR